MVDHVTELQRAVRAIPAGMVSTYGALARAIGTSPRAAGRLMGSHGRDLPWWRVVNASGEPPPHVRVEALAQYLAEATPLARDTPDSVRVDLTRARWRGLR